MLTFLLVSALVLAALGLGSVALPFLVLGGVIWLVLLPVKLVLGLVVGLVGGAFRLLFGLFGALLALLLAPFALLLGAVALVVAFLGALISLITPLIPVALLLLLGWGIYRGADRQGAAL
jgi:hypothetical protein